VENLSQTNLFDALTNTAWCHGDRSPSKSPHVKIKLI